MKKRILLSLIFCFCIVYGVNAQIQRKIMDTEIGVSTKNDVANILKSKNIQFKESKDGIEAQNVTFANSKWETVSFAIDADKLIGVMFMTKNIKEIDIEIIKSVLKKKYENYQMTDTSYMSAYFDKETAVMIVSLKQKAVLGYVDGSYIQKLMSMYTDDL